MQLWNTFVSVAAFAACITPVFSAPAAEPVGSELDFVKRASPLSDIANTCYSGVKSKCDGITAKIDAAVNAQIDAKLAADIVVDLQVVVDLIVKLAADLKAKIDIKGLALVDVTACINVVIAIVNLCAAVLIKIKACLSVSVSVKVFAAVVIKLAACIKVLINLLISVCLGKEGGLVISITAILNLVLKLTACLQAFVKACVALGVSV